MGFLDIQKQFARHATPPFMKLIQGKDCVLLPEFQNGTPVTEAEADQKVEQLKTGNQYAFKVRWKDGYIVYLGPEVKKRKPRKERQPVNIRYINGVQYVIVDPLSYLKSYKEATRLIREATRALYKSFKVKWKDHYVVYRTQKPVIKYKPVKNKVQKKQLQLRTQAFFDTLTPRQIRTMGGKKYIKKA